MFVWPMGPPRSCASSEKQVMHIVLNAPRHSRGLPAQGIRWESVLRTAAAAEWLFLQVLDLRTCVCFSEDPFRG